MGSALKIAAVTMGYNEKTHLPIWANYYARRLGVESLYVIDHGSTDHGSDRLARGINVVRIPRADAFDESPRTHFVTNFVRSLLQYFDAVIYNDCDEIIVPHPGKYQNFQDFLAKASPVTRPVGLHLFQALDREARIDWTQPILGQRRFCRYTAAMSKPTIVKTPVEWAVGFHAARAPEAPAFADDAMLFHLKSIDRDHSLSRLAETRAMAWSASNIEGRISNHHRTEDALHMEIFYGSPLDELKAVDDLTFEFSADIARARAETVCNEGFYTIPHFQGKVAEVPPEFFGLF